MRRRDCARVGRAWAGVPVWEICASGWRAGGRGLGGELWSDEQLEQQVVLEQADDEEHAHVVICCVRDASSTQKCPAGRRPPSISTKATTSDAPEPPTWTEMTLSMLLDDSAMLLQRSATSSIMSLL